MMIEKVFKSFGYTILTAISLWGLNFIYNNGTRIVDNAKGFTQYSLFISFVFLFAVLCLYALTFTIKAFTNLISAFYYEFFYKPKDEYDHMQITIDQNDIIRESYMRFKDGRKIPIYLTRITINENKDNDINEEINNG